MMHNFQQALSKLQKDCDTKKERIALLSSQLEASLNGLELKDAKIAALEAEIKKLTDIPDKPAPGPKPKNSKSKHDRESER
jgi:septal ring factor EnvC (AmiA/AmiB activator)